MKTPKWTVTSVVAKPDYILWLTFTDGSRKVYNARPLLEKPIYEPLKSLLFFLTARVECGTVVWSDEVDIAPEHLYECGENIEN